MADCHLEVIITLWSRRRRKSTTLGVKCFRFLSRKVLRSTVMSSPCTQAWQASAGFPLKLDSGFSPFWKAFGKPSGSLHQKHVDSLLWVWHRSEVSEGLLGQARQINLRKWRERMEWALAAAVEAQWSSFLLPLTSSGHSQTTKAYLYSVEKPLKWRRRGGASLSDAHLLQLEKNHVAAAARTNPKFTDFTQE